MTLGEDFPTINRAVAAAPPLAAASSSAELPSQRARAWLVFAIKLAVGVSLVAFILWHYDLRSSFQLIRRERPILFVAAI
ncbi:MAG: hypothetical protein JOZ29_10900, partial [Deltaproteobacteria bacterium]|nr:hypothetical protein [Deltaproteobacteria bacterium]